MQRDRTAGDAGTSPNAEHLNRDGDRGTRQPYAAEVDDYAGEKAAPPEAKDRKPRGGSEDGSRRGSRPSRA